MFNLISRLPVTFVMLNIMLQCSMCMDESMTLPPTLAQQFRAELAKIKSKYEKLKKSGEATTSKHTKSGGEAEPKPAGAQANPAGALPAFAPTQKEYTFTEKPLGLTIVGVDNKVIVTKVDNQGCLRQGIVAGSQLLSVNKLRWGDASHVFTKNSVIQELKTAQLPIKISFKCPLTGQANLFRPAHPAHHFRPAFAPEAEDTMQCIDIIEFPEAEGYDMKTLKRVQTEKTNLVEDRYGVYASKDRGSTLIMVYATEDLGKLGNRLAFHKARLSRHPDLFDRFVVNRFSKPSDNYTKYRDTKTALYGAAIWHRPESIMVLLKYGADPREVYRKVEKQAGADVVIRRMSALEACIDQREVVARERDVGRKQVCIDILKHAEANWEAAQGNPDEMKRVQGERSAIYKQWKDAHA